jgi:hypothetical protein
MTTRGELGLTVASAPYASCTDAPAPGIQLWSTGAISPSTTWDHGPAWHERLGTQTPPACAGETVRFPLTAFMSSHVQGADSLTFGIRAASETGDDAWKQFRAGTLSVSTIYDNPPDLPSNPVTAPGGPCRTGDPSATLTGRGDVTLQTVVTDPDHDPLSVEFVVRNEDGVVVEDASVASGSGESSRLTLPSGMIERWPRPRPRAPGRRPPGTPTRSIPGGRRACPRPAACRPSRSHCTIWTSTP